jgi:hypothetical protein
MTTYTALGFVRAGETLHSTASFEDRSNNRHTKQADSRNSATRTALNAVAVNEQLPASHILYRQILTQSEAALAQKTEPPSIIQASTLTTPVGDSIRSQPYALHAVKRRKRTTPPMDARTVATACFSCVEDGDCDRLIELSQEANFSVQMRDFNSWTLAMTAAAHGQTHIILVLHTLGANFSLKNKDGQAALDIAITANHPHTAAEIRSILSDSSKRPHPVSTRSRSLADNREIANTPSVATITTLPKPPSTSSIMASQAKLSENDPSENYPSRICQECGGLIRHDLASHQQSIGHLYALNAIRMAFAQQAKDSPTATSTTKEARMYTKGYDILLKQGWSQGTGLGSNSEGITQPIQTAMKLDSTGIGYHARLVKTSSQLSEEAASLTRRTASGADNPIPLVAVKPKILHAQALSKMAKLREEFRELPFC